MPLMPRGGNELAKSVPSSKWAPKFKSATMTDGMVPDTDKAYQVDNGRKRWVMEEIMDQPKSIL